LILLSVRSPGATPSIAATYEFGAVDEKTCAVFRRNAVPQSINTAQSIDAHIEPVPAAEDVYLTAENSAFRLPPNPGRFWLLASRPAFSAWQLHSARTHRTSRLFAPLRAVRRSRFSPDEPPDFLSAKPRHDSARKRPFMTEATVETASMSLANMEPALALFVSCTVDAIKK
jgi:hypothetical protein